MAHKHINRAILLLCFCLMTFAVLAASLPPAVFPLEGPHKFRIGDDASWASPDLDDAGWQTVQVPGIWQTQSLQPEKAIGWYRIHFVAPDSFKQIQVAVALGVIGNADEVFLNGARIGGEGRISDWFVEANVERLYKVPEGLIRFNHDNLLAVRVMNSAWAGGIVRGPVAIGDYGLLLREKFDREKYAIALETGFLVFSVFSFFFFYFLYRRAAGAQEFLYAWLCLLLCAFDLIVNSRLFYEAGLKTPFMQRLVYTTGSVLPTVFLLFTLKVFQEKLTTPIKALMGVIWACALIFFPAPRFELLILLYYIWLPAYVAISVLILYLAIKAYRRKLPEAGPLLAGVVVIVFASLAMDIGSLLSVRVSDLPVLHLGIVAFLIFLMYAMASRFVRLQENLRRASEKVLAAHEEERKRLARELHDGVGQSMLAIKLSLQMMNARAQAGAPVERESLPELIGEISDSIDELRHVAMGLRPSFLEEVEFGDALKWYAREFQKRAGVEVSVEAEQVAEVSTRVKDHLFRIYQEALSNICKHAGASRVEVTLAEAGHRLRLVIKDDGGGFDLREKHRQRAGLGLETIEERAELLGGLCRVESAPGAGTTIYVETPLT
jgi:signal transduction histidine kinase